MRYLKERKNVKQITNRLNKVRFKATDFHIYISLNLVLNTSNVNYQFRKFYILNPLHKIIITLIKERP